MPKSKFIFEMSCISSPKSIFSQPWWNKQNDYCIFAEFKVNAAG